MLGPLNSMMLLHSQGPDFLRFDSSVKFDTSKGSTWELGFGKDSVATALLWADVKYLLNPYSG
jgi:hypothetical protein